jgi:hypothetical protein
MDGDLRVEAGHVSSGTDGGGTSAVCHVTCGAIPP